MLLNLDRCRHHKLKQGKGDLGCRQSSGGGVVVIGRSDLDYIATDNLEAIQTSQDGEKLARGPSSSLRRSSC